MAITRCKDKWKEEKEHVKKDEVEDIKTDIKKRKIKFSNKTVEVSLKINTSLQKYFSSSFYLNFQSSNFTPL